MNLPVCPRSSRPGLLRRVAALSTLAALTVAAPAVHGVAEQMAAVAAEVKTYLVTKLQRMDAAAHDYVVNADAYQKIVDAAGGDYNRVASEHGTEALALVSKMQGDFRVYHNDGYETIEGITAGTKEMVDFDTYLDAGVPKGEATTDSPSAPLVLKGRDGKILSDRNGNLFHYIIEPTLWGTKEIYVRRLSPDAAAKVKPVTVLPRGDILTASADECARKMDELLGIATKWQPTLDECVGALVWMTPTLNGYFDDWRDSRYNPTASLGLQLICNAILPEVEQKDPALAARLKSEYNDIIGFIARVDARERASGSKMNAAQIEELAFQAKRLTDQLTPHLKQMAAELSLRLPPKPTLA